MGVIIGGTPLINGDAFREILRIEPMVIRLAEAKGPKIILSKIQVTLWAPYCKIIPGYFGYP
jgi:hypothetical protein